MERLYSVLIGYAFGLFQTAFILGKMKGIDIRKHGSGNAGTTNTLRVLGTKAGLIVFFGDVAKCILAIVCTYFLFGRNNPEMMYLIKIYTALGAILGHNYPFYLKFRGGKGIAATAGLILAFHWSFIPVGVVMFFVAFLLTHYVSLGSLLVYAGFMTQMVLSGQLGLFGMDQTLLLELYGISAFLTVMAFWKHRENIKRLVSGAERKTYLFHKDKMEKQETIEELQADEKQTEAHPVKES